MGFGVRIETEASRILDRLQTNPAEVFRGPYLGYLLFLFDAVAVADAPFRGWFRENVESLDALTGSDIAFAVFVREFHCQLETNQWQKTRSPRHVGTLTKDEFQDRRDIRELVKHGRFGTVSDGDQISIVNDAVYAFAKELGVTAQLPCIIAFDGFPDPRHPWSCFPITTGDLKDLYSKLRMAVGHLQNHPTRGTYQEALSTLWELTQSRARLAEEDVAKRKRIKKLLKRTEQALKGGNVRELNWMEAHLEAMYPDYFSVLERIRNATLQSGHFSTLLRILHDATCQDWPQDAHDVGGLEERCAKHTVHIDQVQFVRPLFSSREEATRLYHRLLNLRARFVETTMQSLPPLEQWITKFCKRSTPECDQKIFHNAQSILEMPDQPAWTEILASVLTFPPGPEEFVQEARSSRSSSQIMEWFALPDLLRQLGAFDILGLAKAMRTAMRRFGDDIRFRAPTAFISYASTDRLEVIRRIQGMKAYQPRLDVFIDFHSLYPGDTWRERLTEEIRQRDYFFLFWSEAANQSQHVQEEWQTALMLNKPILPVPLCTPREQPPPPQLAHLHFGDWYAEFLGRESPLPA